MSNNKITNYSNFGKPNYKILKFITIILSILILICLILLVIGFIDKFDKITKKEDLLPNLKLQEYEIFYPNGSELISFKFNQQSYLMLWYKYLNDDYIITVNLKNKKIIRKITLKKSDSWKIK